MKWFCEQRFGISAKTQTCHINFLRKLSCTLTLLDPLSRDYDFMSIRVQITTFVSTLHPVSGCFDAVGPFSLPSYFLLLCFITFQSKRFPFLMAIPRNSSVVCFKWINLSPLRYSVNALNCGIFEDWIIVVVIVMRMSFIVMIMDYHRW